MGKVSALVYTYTHMCLIIMDAHFTLCWHYPIPLMFNTNHNGQPLGLKFLKEKCVTHLKQYCILYMKIISGKIVLTCSKACQLVSTSISNLIGSGRAVYNCEKWIPSLCVQNVE